MKLTTSMLPRVSAGVTWTIIDSGRQPGRASMFNDREDLMAMNRGHLKDPQIRLFQWEKPIISYGYLLDVDQVKKWARDLGGAGIVQRPTGGGAVFHNENDLSISILWPRRKNILPENPKECYRMIHSKLMTALHNGGASPRLALNAATNGITTQSCESAARATDAVAPPKYENGRFSACYDEPVCNDVMLGREKIIGGALRLTRNAILYQGNIKKFDGNINELMRLLRAVFHPHL